MGRRYELYVKNPETGKVGKAKEVPEEEYDSLCEEWRDTQTHGLTSFIWEI